MSRGWRKPKPEDECEALYYCVECDVIHLFRITRDQNDESPMLVESGDCPIMELDYDRLAKNKNLLLALRTHELVLIGVL